MRKLKLQVNITLDGFIARPDGRNDWMWASMQPDETRAGFYFVIDLAKTCDTILLGRGMTKGFTEHWEKIANTMPDAPEYPLAKQMVDMPKIMFSKTQTEITAQNLVIENGDLETAVKALKSQPGKDLLVYGGAGFVSSLIDLDLVDEYYLIVNPVAISEGMPIFRKEKMLKLESSTAFKSGKVVNTYTRF